MEPVPISESLRSSSTLSAEDEDEIKIKERNEGRAKAVDLLISKMIPLKKPDWPDKFLKALKPHHPRVVDTLTDVEEILKEDVLASVSPKIEPDITEGMASDPDLFHLIELLVRSDLWRLYYTLGLTTAQIERAENKASTADGRRKAIHVFRFWRKANHQNATHKVLLDALVKCKLTQAKETLETQWKMEDTTEASEISSSQTSSGVRVSTSDFMDIIKILGPDDLQYLYGELGLTNAQILRAERKQGTSDVFLKAMPVLELWRTERGHEATRQEILEALQRCGRQHFKEELEEEWTTATCFPQYGKRKKFTAE